MLRRREAQIGRIQKAVARALSEAGIITPHVPRLRASTDFGPLGATSGELSVR